MTTASRPTSPIDGDRAGRILDVARDLLLAWGYKRVTVDEVARHARIGKGTVYLHWKTKDVLFAELLKREFQEGILPLISQIEEDPRVALPGRLVAEAFLQQVRNPLAHAIRTGDEDVLGALGTTPQDQPLAREIGHYALLVDLVDAWRSVGALPSDAPAADQVCVIDAVLTGFFSGGITPDEQMPALEHRASLLARAVDGSCAVPEEPEPSAVDAVAERVLAVLAAARA